MNWKLFQLFLVVVPLKIAISADVETDWWNIIRVSGSYQMYSYCDSVWWTDFCFNSILTFWITHDISIYKKEKIQWNSVYFLETFRFFSINFCFFRKGHLRLWNLSHHKKDIGITMTMGQYGLHGISSSTDFMKHHPVWFFFKFLFIKDRSFCLSQLESNSVTPIWIRYSALCVKWKQVMMKKNSFLFSTNIVSYR